MSELFPYVPLNGVAPVGFLLMAGLMGILFGWFLERSGFGSAKMLTAVFTMRDFRVYRVMFTAVLTAMIGAQLLAAVGVLELGLLEISTTYLWPMALGGLLFGVAFYLGGFCPGTAVVAMVRGRLDGLAFLVGIVLGIYGFALFFDGPGQASWFQNFYLPDGAGAMTLVQHPHVWILVTAITVGVIISFRYLYILEQRFSMRTPEELEEDEPRAKLVKPKTSRTARGLVVFTGVMLFVLGIMLIGDDEPEALAIGSEIPAPVAVDETQVPLVDPVSLAGWLIADANRIADDKPANSHVIDLRNLDERRAVPIRGPLLLCEGGDNREEVYESSIAELNGVLVDADRNKPIVVVDDGTSTAGSDLVLDLRVDGVNAMLLAGGSPAWDSEVLSEAAVWPEWIVDASADEVPSVDDYHDDVRLWMFGDILFAPAYMAIPGTMQLPSEAATVVATGGGGGGCG